MVPPLELLRLPLTTELPYLNIALFCFDSEFVPFVCLFFPTVLNTSSFELRGQLFWLILPKKVPIYVHFVKKLQTFDLRALGGSFCRKFEWGAVYTFL